MLKKSILTIARILLVLSVPIFLLLTNLYIFMSPAFLRYEYGKADFPPSPGFTDAERHRDTGGFGGRGGAFIQ